MDEDRFNDEEMEEEKTRMKAWEDEENEKNNKI